MRRWGEITGNVHSEYFAGCSAQEAKELRRIFECDGEDLGIDRTTG